MSINATFLKIIKKAGENYRAGHINKAKLEYFVTDITGIFVAFSEGKQDAPETLEQFQRQLDSHGII